MTSRITGASAGQRTVGAGLAWFARIEHPSTRAGSIGSPEDLDDAARSVDVLPVVGRGDVRLLLLEVASSVMMMRPPKGR